MLDVNLLNASIVKNGFREETFGEQIGMSYQAWRRRRNGETEFTLTEIENVRKALNLNQKELYSIFFG